MRAGTFVVSKPVTSELTSQSSTLTEALQQLLDQPIRPKSTKTTRLYQGFLDNHITPTIGKIQLGELNYIHIQILMTSLQEALPSGFSVNAVRAYLRSALNELQRQGLIDHNPVERTKPAPTAPRKIVYWTRDEIDQIVQAAPHQEARAVLSIACYLGLRTGEINGLQVRDIDLEHKTLTIDRAVRWHKGQFELYPCKQHSRRTIPLAGDAGAMVIEQVKAHLETLDNPQPTDFIFGQTPNRPRHETTFNAWHHKAIDRANQLITIAHGNKNGTPKLINHGKLHGTRSTTITELRRQGVNMETIRTLVGHRDTTTTDRSYLAVDQTDIAAALEKTTRISRSAPVNGGSPRPS